MAKPVPRDLILFLSTRVFPHAPRSRLEELVSCGKIMLLGEGEEAGRPGLYIVYNGTVLLDGSEYSRGDYLVLAGGQRLRAKSEAIVIHVPPGCGEDVARLGPGEPCRVQDLVHRSPVTARPGETVLDAVRRMNSLGVSSVVVVDEEWRPIGVFTDTDLRRLVASRGCSLDGPLERVMTRSPVTVQGGVSCFDAVRVMMERNIKHLIVVDDGGRLQGVVTVRDVAYAEALGPLYVKRIIDRAGSVDELGEAYRRLVGVLRRHASRLHPATGAGRVAAMVAMASLALRSVASRAALLAAKRLNAPEEGWAYIVMGSNARLEQSLPTDRDTALVYRDGVMGEAAARRLAEEIEDILDRVGFPGCSHGYTARSLVYSLEQLRGELARAARNPSGDREVVLIGLFSDAEAAYPDPGRRLAEAVRRTLVEEVEEAGSAPYLRGVLAAYRPRLGAFGRLPRRLDLKRDGLAPIVYAAKAMSVAAGIWEPIATGERLEWLAARGIVSSDLAADASEALSVLLGMAAWSSVIHGTRVIETDELSGVERAMLRESLRVAARLVDRARAPA